MRKYQNTLFDAATFNALWAKDARGVRAEAKARGPESKLAHKVAALGTRTPAPAPAKPTRKRVPGGNAATRAANASGHAPGSAPWWIAYRAHTAATRALASI